MPQGNTRPAPEAITSDLIARLLSAAPPRGVLPVVNGSSTNAAQPEKPVLTTRSSDWIGHRHAVRDAAFAYLKARCILVTVVDRDALVREYFVTGKRFRHSLEMVVELAESMGFEIEGGR